jgi:hypothetical protein
LAVRALNLRTFGNPRQQQYWNLPECSLLDLAKLRGHAKSTGPHDVSLAPSEFSHGYFEDVRPELDVHLWVSLQVIVPVGMPRSASIGSDDRQAAVQLRVANNWIDSLGTGNGTDVVKKN